MQEANEKPAIPDHAADTVNLVAHDMKTLVKKIQELRHLGIEDSDIALPRICVVGDQSTGKSSLIEGMSDIKVPRSSGTCTRCPMEINLTEGEPHQPWTCQIWLSRKYIYEGRKKMPTSKRRLGPWIEQNQADEPFITVTNKADVQEALKWAQLAILNPTRSSNDYVPGRNGATDSNHCDVKFSPNVVRLDISSPGFPNLSFYDLPGVISITDADDERFLVTLVEHLVQDYIKQENCIVLLAQTMTDDATNSSAARIIRDIGGAKMRTLGVLTKPDRIQTGESYDQWRGILKGTRFSLGHGYYVVKNNPDPRVDHSQAREEEAEFFSSAPWSTELSDYHERFGTRRLQSALSVLLLQQILGCLPRITNQIDEKAAAINAELQTLPNPPCENVQYILSSKLHELKDETRCHIDGGSARYPLQKICYHIALDFKRSLAKTRPIVTLLAGTDRVACRIENERDDSECEMISIQKSVKPVKRKTPTNGPAPPSPPKVKRDPETSGYDTLHFDKFNGPAKQFTWEEVKEIREHSYRAGLPDQTDPKAIEILNQLCVAHWDAPMKAFLKATHKKVKDTLMQQLQEVFSQYHQTGLYRELVRIVGEYLQQLHDDHFEQAKEMFNIEHGKPFTMDAGALENATTKQLEHLKTRRHQVRAGCYLDLQGKFPSDDPRREAEIKKLGEAELGPDLFAQEVKMMAVRPFSPFQRSMN